MIEGFSGPGGMSLGLHQAGFQIACAFDHDARAVDTHNRNLGGRAFVADAAQLAGDDPCIDYVVEKSFLRRLLALRRGIRET